jgi:Glycosyltransferase like family 2
MYDRTPTMTGLLGFSVICHRPYMDLLPECLESIWASLRGNRDVPVVACVSGVPADHPRLLEARREGERRGLFHVEHSPRTLTIGQARNRTVPFCGTRWVLFIDADILVAPEFAERALAFLGGLHDPDCAAVCAAFEPSVRTPWGYLEYLNDVGCLLGKLAARRTPLWGCWNSTWAEKVRQRFPEVVPLAEVLDGPVALQSLQGCGQIIRRDFVTANGFVDFWEDREMAYAIGRAGKSILFHPALVVRHDYQMPWRGVLRRKWLHGLWHAQTMRQRQRRGDPPAAWGPGDYLKHQALAILKPPPPFTWLPGGRLYYFLSTVGLNLGCLAGFLSR